VSAAHQEADQPGGSQDDGDHEQPMHRESHAKDDEREHCQDYEKNHDDLPWINDRKLRTENAVQLATGGSSEEQEP
jgi:hypothetical protein